jgi:hypothetical protein
MGRSGHVWEGTVLHPPKDSHVTQAIIPNDPEPSTGGAASQAALWLFGLTASTLVFAALLLLGVLAQAASIDARLNGFVTALALVVGIVGVAAVAYVVVSAHRAGYLGQPEARQRVDMPAERAGDPPSPSSGLRVVPALPADLVARRRRELAARRDVRATQARAIATVESTQRRVSPTPAFATRSVQLMRLTPQVRPTAGLAARRSTAVLAASRPATRPTGVPPTLRMSAPPVHRQVRSAQLQLAVADLRAGHPGAGPAQPRMPGHRLPAPVSYVPPMPLHAARTPAPPARPQGRVPARPR